MEEVKLNVFQPTFPATSLPGQRLPANKLNHDQYRPRRRVFPIVFESHSTSRRIHSHCSPKLTKSGPSRRVRIADARRFSPSPQKTVILIFLPAATLDRRYLFLFLPSTQTVANSSKYISTVPPNNDNGCLDSRKLQKGHLYRPQLCVRLLSPNPLNNTTPIQAQRRKANGEKTNSDHITELNNTKPKQPFFFLKPASSILLPREGPVLRPRGTNLHYEVELGLVMGKSVRDLDPEDNKGAIDAIRSALFFPLPSQRRKLANIY